METGEGGNPDATVGSETGRAVQQGRRPPLPLLPSVCLHAMQACTLPLGERSALQERSARGLPAASLAVHKFRFTRGGCCCVRRPDLDLAGNARQGASCRPTTAAQTGCAPFSHMVTDGGVRHTRPTACNAQPIAAAAAAGRGTTQGKGTTCTT